MTKTGFLLLLMMAFCSNSAAAILASGDGFSISSDYLEAQKRFFHSSGFETDDNEHLKAALKMRLFAKEGLEKGIIDKLPDPTSLDLDRTVSEFNDIFNKVVQYLIETYPIPEDAIESYYASYPDKFLKRLNTPKMNLHQEDLLPLDDALKKWIHDKIAQTKKAAIIDQTYERLKVKYHVVIGAS